MPLEISREPKHYQLAFEACAMAAFAKDAVDSKYCNCLAIAKYGLALRAIHDALGATAMVQKDATLASVLLLALFECINPTTGGVRGWYKHIIGAMNLVKERIRQKSAKQIAHSLFISVRTQMVLHSLVTLSGDDDEVWWPQDNITHKYTLTQKLCAEASSLGAKAKTLLDHPRNEEYARELFKKCQDHDRRCKNWWESSFANTQHRIAWTDRVLGSEHNRFQPLMLWNMLLHARVLLNMSIVRCVACIYEPKKNDYKTSTEYAQAFLELQSLISNITISFQQRKEMISALGGYFMTWPLALMLSSKRLQESQRAVFNDQLKYIGKKYLGICHAFVAPMARLEEQEQHPFGSPKMLWTAPNRVEQYPY
ncbi:hypothetical protein VFPPC_10604 [Pochonia chlamydosporia 170]|uniref:Uncharacterized protein n=1 Tax=Pochonia chlamydosporia 170 TaxID=1380566 RepID=A0A179F4S0_METCM|nr:hypothetical protein VFPPC_10604 [Pochonia chlamydosporia 170]OAQ60173.1 hypothetical protein VFPPC_10604 [Pochonia chlamydosporia 170]